VSGTITRAPEAITKRKPISLESGRSSIALEREYWTALEALAYDDGWHNWRNFFYVNVLPNKPDDMPLASHVRKSITEFLFSEYDKAR
jgi:predicted DNA-binding ribbon-helix-helix protein